MPWPEWLSFSSTSQRGRNEVNEPDPRKESTSIKPITSNPHPDALPSSWPSYISPQTVLACAGTAVVTLAATRGYKRYLRRIPNVNHFPPALFRKRSVYGYVTSVGDGDNFRLFHTPGGRWAGWGWLRGRRPQELRGKALQDRTIHVRLAGVDAPEMAHFGREAQPYAREALDFLRGYVLGAYVRVRPYRRDQYDRVVATAYRRVWGFWKSDVGLAMLKRGYATVYEAKFGSEFGDKEAEYRAAEERAKERKVGIWQEPGLMSRMLGKKAVFESPRDYKTRMAKREAGN